MVLGQPEAVVTGLLQAAPQDDEVLQGLANIAPFEEGDLLKGAEAAEASAHDYS